MSSIDATFGLKTDDSRPALAVPAIVPTNQVSSGRTSRQIVGLVVFLGCAAILSLGAYLTPASEGLGTHEQLNMPPCGWIMLMDLPCPTCGMTTAVTHAAHGNLVTSFTTQPMGFLFALATTMGLFIGGYTAATGSRVGVVLGSMWTRRFTWTLIGLVLAAWIYKIASHKGLL